MASTSSISPAKEAQSGIGSTTSVQAESKAAFPQSRIGDSKGHKLNFLKGNPDSRQSQLPLKTQVGQSTSTINSTRRRRLVEDVEGRKKDEKPLRDMLEEMRSSTEIKKIGEQGPYAPSFAALDTLDKGKGATLGPKNGRRAAQSMGRSAAQSQGSIAESIADPFSESMDRS
jgi:hypothetical protein